jgi:hypothetical protein
MAKIVGAVFTSHGGFTSTSVHQWQKIRTGRSYRSDVPCESAEEMNDKWRRIASGKQILRERVSALHPDVLVVFGDDQQECFDFTNHPSLAVYLGENFHGRAPLMESDSEEMKPTEIRSASGYPGLATAITSGLLTSGFDPAFMTGLPRPEVGMSHAVMKPLAYLTDFDVPTVPILINAYYAPQITGKRCYEVGIAVRHVVESYDEDLRVVIVGSGGLWHTPGEQESWINEDFDQTGLGFLATGDAAAWATYFDGYVPDPHDLSQDAMRVRRGVSGLPQSVGPQGGTRETLCWICASAVAEGSSSHIVDYVPAYASPAGLAFAYTEEM